MRAMDAVRIGALRGIPGQELTAQTWPKAPPENVHPTLLRLLSGLAKSYSGLYRIGVGSDDRPNGLVIAKARANGIVWDVEHLLASDAWAAVDLLSWASERALAIRGRRIFLQTPPSGMGAEAAPKAAFERYGEGATLRLDPGFGQQCRGEQELAGKFGQRPLQAPVIVVIEVVFDVTLVAG